MLGELGDGIFGVIVFGIGEAFIGVFGRTVVGAG
jgi:hypothetical protein